MLAKWNSMKAAPDGQHATNRLKIGNEIFDFLRKFTENLQRQIFEMLTNFRKVSFVSV